METTSSTSVATDLASYFALSSRFQLHPGPDQYMVGFGDAAFRTATGISNGHLIPRSLTLSFCIPDAREQHRIEPSAYLRSLLVGLRRVTEFLDEDREVMHVVLADGLPEYLGIRNLGSLLNAVHRYLRTTAFHEVAVTVNPGSEIEPALLASAGCTRGILAGGAGTGFAESEAGRGAGEAMAAAGFHATAYRLGDGPFPIADRQWLARLEQALEGHPDQVLLSWRARGCSAASAACILQAVALLEQQGYIAGGADTYVKRDNAPIRTTQTGTRYCDLHGMLRSERTDMIGIGLGATSQVGDVYCRVSTDHLRWSAGLETGHLCVERGLILSENERMRAELMQALACDYELDTMAMEARHDPLFARCLEEALPRLEQVVEGDLAYWDQQVLRLTPLGKLLWRAVADCFRDPDFPAPHLGM